MLKKLKGQDKIFHSKVGNIIYLFTFIFLLPFVSIIHSFVIALIILFLIALTKELYDKYYKRTFIDWFDIVAAFIPYPIVKKINK
nr:MAG TPA: putative periplasmic lipoprotein [Caudoviricetes sp.]